MDDVAETPEEKKPINLASFDGLKTAQEEGIDVDIETPTGEPIGLTIRVAGPDSKRQRNAARKLQEARLRGSKRRLKADDMEKEALELISASVISWKFAPGVTIDGEVPECNLENVKALFDRFPFIREQIDNVASSRAGFSKA